VRPGPGTKTVDFGWLWDILNSDDESLLHANSWIFEDCVQNPKFLSKIADTTVESTGNQIAYLSYPRSGNSFLRKYLQNITGIATGADMALEACNVMQLNGFIGEEITDSSVWFTKSHDPQMSPKSVPHKCNKVICCVRNPYDVMVSMMHFITGVNGATINEDFQKDIPELWQEFIRHTT